MKKHIAHIILAVLILFSLPASVFANFSDEANIGELELVLELKDPYAAVATWAEGVSTRNGRLQYAVMSVGLKEMYFSRFVELGWVTGVSSPWVESYEITEKYRVDDGICRFEVVFTYTDSTDSKYSYTEYVAVCRLNDDWFVSDIERADIKGKVTELILDEDKKPARLFVEAVSAEIGQYDKANVIVGDETKIYEGFTDKELSVGDLTEGVTVLVTFTDDPIIMIYPVSAKARDIRVLKDERQLDTIVYENTQYGFHFILPESWSSFTLVMGQWEGWSVGEPAGDKVVQTGCLIGIRHPLWTEQNPRQDIPIMIFTMEQWNSLMEEEFHIGAAPIGPREIGRNDNYVFAIPARYNFTFLTGFEEVERILEDNPLEPIF